MVKQGANNRYEEDIDMLRIAVTYDNGMVFQHFGHTEQFKVYDTDKGQVLRTEILESNGSGHGALATLLAINKVEVLICGGIGGGAQTALA
ncbi:MAG: NifB/NifX family molybdenum-iron cluster-binding protein, partial [Clostridia bacterium]|nr:NifB/NifX family molybdenum-iron cluster-binding protein [Clostridia bacterium]